MSPGEGSQWTNWTHVPISTKLTIELFPTRTVANQNFIHWPGGANGPSDGAKRRGQFFPNHKDYHLFKGNMGFCNKRNENRCWAGKTNTEFSLWDASLLTLLEIGHIFYFIFSYLFN